MLKNWLPILLVFNPFLLLRDWFLLHWETKTLETMLWDVCNGFGLGTQVRPMTTRCKCVWLAVEFRMLNKSVCVERGMCLSFIFTLPWQLAPKGVSCSNQLLLWFLEWMARQVYFHFFLHGLLQEFVMKIGEVNKWKVMSYVVCMDNDVCVGSPSTKGIFGCSFPNYWHGGEM